MRTLDECLTEYGALEASPLPLWAVAGGLWPAAWFVQLVGHNIEGAKPSFFDELVFLLIGPLFVLEELGVRLQPRKIR
ncbi:MAG TPA: Mpo1-like protein [Nevskiales bacterium]|nr:Mpo1-like protein [Nevskiales bacterium]